MAEPQGIICEECKKSFAQKSTLKRHFLEIHKGVPLPASVTEAKAIKQACQYCSKLITKDHMKRHLENCKARKDPSPTTSSQQLPRRREFDLVDDTSEINGDVFGMYKPLQPMLREYLSKRLNHSKRTIDKHIAALSKFEVSMTNGVSITPKFLTENCNTPEVMDYVIKLETVFDRSAILEAMQSSFKMLFEMGVLRSLPGLKIGLKNNVIQTYLDSTLRGEFFNAFENQNPEVFVESFNHLSIRNILLVETLLATKSYSFVKKLTRGVYLRGSKDVNYENENIYVYDIDSERIEIPAFLRQFLHKYFVIMRRHNMPLQKRLQSGGKVVEVYDPSNDPEVKFFAVKIEGRPVQVEITQDHFKFFHKASTAIKYFNVDDFVNSDVEYKSSSVASPPSPIGSFQAAKPSISARRGSAEMARNEDSNEVLPSLQGEF